jgi:peptide/nickel transport system permease protein
MGAYIARRLIQAIFVLFIVSVMIFLIMRILPGDPVLMYLTRDSLQAASPEQIAAVRHEFGLDQPLYMQYFNWIGNVLHGDLGRSIMFRTSVNDEIGSALPKTIYLGGLAFILSIILGVPLGVIAAVRRGKWPDTISTFLANIGLTAPVFWIGILMVLFFGLYLGWLPIQGFTSPFDDFGKSLSQVVMPVICLTLHPMASIARQIRSSMLEVIREDYIRTAWAQGFPENTVIFGHALKNSLIPVITLMGVNIRNIFGGQVLVETVFNIPGIGRLSIDGLLSQDYAVTQGVILVIALVVVVTNLVVDLSYGWVDPRIRYE